MGLLSAHAVNINQMDINKIVFFCLVLPLFTDSLSSFSETNKYLGCFEEAATQVISFLRLRVVTLIIF